MKIFYFFNIYFWRAWDSCYKVKFVFYYLGGYSQLQLFFNWML
jgi:hypothetical protein